MVLSQKREPRTRVSYKSEDKIATFMQRSIVVYMNDGDPSLELGMMYNAVGMDERLA
jgi:hypothetical protein